MPETEERKITERAQIPDVTEAIEEHHPLPIALHNKLQISVIAKMLGENKESYDAQKNWLDKYLDMLSEIMNGPRGEEVRNLATADKLDEAVEAAIALLQNK